MQDTGVIQGISQAPETISFAAMEQKQQQLAHVILQDPAVESLSSFIGADGTNTTLNSGRMSINLKPLEERKLSASDVIRRLQKSLKQVDGIELYMKPVQNITVDDRVSRTQYQYTLEDPDAERVEPVDRPAGGQDEEAAATGGCGDRPANRGPGGIAGDRSRYRIAAGHRAVHHRQHALRRIWAAPDQHHVHAVEPVSRDSGNRSEVFSKAPANSRICIFRPMHPQGLRARAPPRPMRLRGLRRPVRMRLRLRRPTLRPRRCSARPPMPSPPAWARAAQLQPPTQPPVQRLPMPCRCSAFTHIESATEPLSINHQGQFPAVTVSFNLAPDAALGGAITAIKKVQKDLNMPASVQYGFQGTAASFEGSLSNEGLLILAALAAVYIVLGILYESFIHPITILSTLPSAGRGCIAGPDPVQAGPERGGHHRHHSADRHCEEERHHDGGLCAGGRARAREEFTGTRFTRPACCAFAPS